MKFIDTIEIKNFKSIRHQKIEGCKRINVFIGYPNTGKTNIIEALSLFSIDDNNHNFSDFIRIEKLTTLFYNGDIMFTEQFEKEGTSFEKENMHQIFLDDSHEVERGKRFKLIEKKNDVIDYNSGELKKIDKLDSIRRYEFSKHISYSIKGHSHLSYPHGDNIFNIISTNRALQKEVEELFVSYNLELLYDMRDQKFA